MPATAQPRGNRARRETSATRGLRTYARMSATMKGVMMRRTAQSRSSARAAQAQNVMTFALGLSCHGEPPGRHHGAGVLAYGWGTGVRPGPAWFPAGPRA